MNIYFKIQLAVTLLLSPILGVLGQTQSAIDLKGHLINGVAQFSSGEFSDATTSFSNGSTLEKFEDIAAYNLGRTLMETEDLEGATSAFQQAIASSENSKLKSNAWYNTGNIALQSQDPEAAVNAYKSALRNSSTNNEARHNLAIANKMLQQQEQQEQQEKQEGEEGEEGEKDEEQKQEEQQGEEEQEGEEQKQEEQQGEEEQEGEEQKQEEQQVEGQISKEDMARILENLENKEAEIQAKLRRQKGKGEKKTIEKQW
ncbi:MAG: tetratricopeptide repeat protein [Flavobacteriales bacterium]|nr:tetratricopeptide repeat protein [Flavobacteriales bacterium]MBT7653047.1 tetratricopeptide repeat protein [Flavobacteriales bacterium]